MVWGYLLYGIGSLLYVMGISTYGMGISTVWYGISTYVMVYLSYVYGNIYRMVWGYLLYGIEMSTLCYRDIYFMQLIQPSDKYRMIATKTLGYY